MKNLFNTIIKELGLGPKPTFKELLKNYKPIDAVEANRKASRNSQIPIWLNQSIERVDSNKFNRL